MLQEPSRKRKREHEENISLIQILDVHLPPVLRSIVIQYEKSSIDGKLIQSHTIMNSAPLVCVACTNQHIVIGYVDRKLVEFRDRFTFHLLKTIEMSVNDVVHVNDEEVILVVFEMWRSILIGFNGLEESVRMKEWGSTALALATFKDIVAIGNKEDIHIFDWKEKKRLNTFQITRKANICFMALSETKLFAPDKMHIRIYNIESGTLIGNIFHPYYDLISIAISCDEVYVVEGETGIVNVWSHETGILIRSFNTGKSGSGLAFTPDGQLLVADPFDSKIHLFQ